jgi:hypothetical protein
VDYKGVNVFHRFPTPLSQGIASPDKDINISDMQMNMTGDHLVVVVRLNPRWGGHYYYPGFSMLLLCDVAGKQASLAAGGAFNKAGGTTNNNNSVWYDNKSYPVRIELTHMLLGFRFDIYLSGMPFTGTWVPQINNFNFDLQDMA